MRGSAYTASALRRSDQSSEISATVSPAATGDRRQCDIGLADDADEGVSVDDRQPANLVAAHDTSASRTSSSAPTVTPRPRRGSRRSRGRVPALGQALHHDVAVGEHALQPFVLPADGSAPTPRLAPRAAAIRSGPPSRQRVAGHDVACHGHWSGSLRELFIVRRCGHVRHGTGPVRAGLTRATPPIHGGRHVVLTRPRRAHAAAASFHGAKPVTATRPVVSVPA